MTQKERQPQGTSEASAATEHAVNRTECEGLFREFVEGADDLFTRVDGDGKFVYVNRAAESVFGMKPEACIGLSAFDFIHPEDRNRTQSWFESCLKDRVSTATMENRQVSRAGEVRQMLWKCSFHYDASGTVTGINSIARDITDRKQTEEQLTVFQRFAQASGQCFGMTDLDGQIIYGNPALLRLCGVENLEEIHGQSFTIFHPREERTKLEEEVFPAMMREGQWMGELTLLSRTGQSTPVVSNHFVVLDERGKPCCLAAVMTDITERMRDHEAVQRSEERFLELAKTVGEIVWTASVDGSRLTYINPMAERVYGRTCEEFYKDADLWLNVAHHEDQQRVREGAQRLLERGHREIEYRILRPNGEVRWLLDRARVILDVTGHPTELGGIATDITDLKEAEERLRSEDKVLKRLLDRQERERQLVANEIHDGVVQDIVGAKMLYEGIVDELEDETQTRNEQIGQVKRLLEEAVAEARRLIGELRPMILDEAGVVEAIKHLVAREYCAPPFEVELLLPAQLYGLDPMLESTVFRIVKEALTNAKRHSQSTTAVVKLVQKDERLFLEIQDQGVGLDPNNSRSAPPIACSR